MAGTIKPVYGTAGSLITCTFGNSGSGTVSQHGRLSAAINNQSDCFEEVMLSGYVKSGTSPSGDKLIIVYGLGSTDDGSHYTDGYAAGDADSAAVPVTALPIKSIPASASTTTYHFGPARVSLAFGGEVPGRWMIFPFNDHGVTPSTTNADHSFWYQGRYTAYS